MSAWDDRKVRDLISWSLADGVGQLQAAYFHADLSTLPPLLAKQIRNSVRLLERTQGDYEVWRKRVDDDESFTEPEVLSSAHLK